MLAVLCLAMLTAGLFGLRGAARERQRALDDAGRLRESAVQYALALEALADGAPSSEAAAKLARHQAEHDRLASRHRAEMAMYTATQSGLRSGTAALDQADALFAEGKRQYEAGLAAFEEQQAAFAAQVEQFRQGKRQLADLQALYALAVQQLANAEGHARAARNMSEVLDSEDPDARRQLTLDAYDEALTAADQAAALLQSLKELTPTLDAIARMDAASLDGLGELGQIGELAGTGLTMPAPDPGQLAQLKELYDALWPQTKALIAQMDELLPAVDGAVQEASGKSLAELRRDAQAQRDAVASGAEDAPISDEQFALLRETYAQTREQLLAALDAGDALLGRLRAAAEQIGAMLAAVQAQVNEADAMLEQGKAAIEQGKTALAEAGEQIAAGEQALYDSRAMIWWQMGQQREKAAKLAHEKERLAVEARQLKELEEAVEARRTLEKAERSLRLTLRKRDEVAARHDDGAQLQSAALLSAQALVDSAEGVWKGRSLACLLMIAGALFGFAGLPAAFERTHSRFWLLAPVLLCLLCALGAEGLCLHLGRGSSYSALGAAAFALGQLTVSLPKEKKRM